MCLNLQAAMWRVHDASQRSLWVRAPRINLHMHNKADKSPCDGNVNPRMVILCPPLYLHPTKSILLVLLHLHLNFKGCRT